MDHLAELKEFARLHSRGQGMAEPQIEAALSAITSDEPGEGSWARVWTAKGDQLMRQGRLLDACRHFALARFPHHGDEDRREAQRRCVRAFDEWRRDQQGIERLEFDLPDGTVACWAAGLNPARPRPLLLVMGGIVSVKEQWAPALPLFAKLGYAAVVTEMPGVGENTLPYRADSWRMIPQLLDRLADRARVTQTSTLTLSFSGHMALRAASEDPRIRAINTVGAPISDFFTNDAWWPQVPRITVETLRRLTGAADEQRLRSLLAEFPLTRDDLSAIRVPVGYVVSSRDEIIPAREWRLLSSHLPRVRFKEFDDVHGSPGHLGAMRRWLVLSLLRTRISARLTGTASRPTDRQNHPRPTR